MSAVSLLRAACLITLMGCAHTPEGATPKPPRTAETTAAPTVGVLPEGVGVPPGSPAPDAEVEFAVGGGAVNLASLYADGPVLLVFYRGGWCPFCNYQVHELATAWPEFQARGVTPVLVSVDRVDEAAKTQASWEIPFPVLSDPTLKAHSAFKVNFAVDDETVKKYARFGIDLEESSGQTHHTIAVPSMFLIDRDGVVRWAHAELDYKTRPTVEQVLAAIDGAIPRR
jgi:peroxiredoxin